MQTKKDRTCLFINSPPHEPWAFRKKQKTSDCERQKFVQAGALMIEVCVAAAEKAPGIMGTEHMTFQLDTRATDGDVSYLHGDKLVDVT